VELFIIRVKFAIYYFLHFNKVRQVAARLRAKSAIYDCLVCFYDLVVTMDDDLACQSLLLSVKPFTYTQYRQLDTIINILIYLLTIIEGLSL